MAPIATEDLRPTVGDARVGSFQHGAVTAAEVVESIKKNGGVFIRNFLDPGDVKTIEGDIRPHIEGRRGWEGEFFPKQTSRVTGLVAKSRTFADKAIMHPLWQAVVDALLTHRHTSWVGPKKQHTSVSKPQLAATICFSIGPGAFAQGLHRDSGNSHQVLPATTPAEYALGRDDIMGLFVAGKRCTRANGTTRFVPGSHLDATATPPPDEEADPDAVVYADMAPGDAFMMLGSCYHGGSANRTADEERLIFSCFATKGYLRAEENQYLVLDREQVLSFPEAAQRHFGWDISEPYVGWVEYTVPYKYIRDGKALFEEMAGREEKEAREAAAVAA